MTLALLAVSELSLRRYFFGRTYSYYAATEVYWEDQHTLLLYLPDPTTMWKLRPGIDLRVEEWIRPYGPDPVEPVHYEWTLSTNTRGYRGPEFEPEKAHNTLRVLCLGDSRTLGEGLKADETYPGQLSKILGRNTEVLNLGADGWSAFQGRVLLEDEGVHYKPDVVIACFGINDADRAWGVSDSVKVAGMNKRFVEIQSLLYRSMTFYAGTRLFLRAKAYLFGKTPVGSDYGTGPHRLSPDAYEQEIEKMRQICEAHEIRFVYLILPLNRYYPWQIAKDDSIIPFDTYNKRVSGSESSGHSITLDLRNSSLGRDPVSHFLDDMHLSGLGAKRVAEYIASTLQSAGIESAVSPALEPTPGR